MAEYHLAQQSWKAEGALVVSDESGQQLLVVPIQFLRLGRVQKYSYVQQQVEATWREPGHLVRADGTAALADDTAIAGKLTFRRAGMCGIVYHSAILTSSAAARRNFDTLPPLHSSF